MELSPSRYHVIVWNQVIEITSFASALGERFLEITPSLILSSSSMEAYSQQNTAPPSSVTDAVLVKSSVMPEGSQKVEELDFNKFSGHPITVDDLVSGMDHMGFQASSVGQAVKIINDMVSNFTLFLALY